MPAILMRDETDDNLYLRFSKVALRTGVYTARDYADIIGSLVKHWNIARLWGLSDLTRPDGEIGRLASFRTHLLFRFSPVISAVFFLEPQWGQVNTDFKTISTNVLSDFRLQDCTIRQLHE